MLHHLKPGGRAGIVLANGSMSSSQNNEGRIRAAMVEAEVVEVMIALPGQLFFNTQIPACLWFLAKDKRARRGEVLFIDARADVAGYCRSVKLAEIAEQGHVLTPGRYVGAAAVEDNDADFATKMQALTETLGEQMANGGELVAAIRARLGGLGYGV
jgi:type I restriction enzyme M protein